MSTQNEVRKASEQFYEALNRLLTGDASDLIELHDSPAKANA